MANETNSTEHTNSGNAGLTSVDALMLTATTTGSTSESTHQSESVSNNDDLLRMALDSTGILGDGIGGDPLSLTLTLNQVVNDCVFDGEDPLTGMPCLIESSSSVK